MSVPFFDTFGWSSQLELPDTSNLASVKVQTTKIIARMNAVRVSQSEVDGLMEERKQLLDKKFAGSITRQELNRLAYVRWSLDRVEDATRGHGLDALEEAVRQYENLCRQIEMLGNMINQNSFPLAETNENRITIK